MFNISQNTACLGFSFWGLTPDVTDLMLTLSFLFVMMMLLGVRLLEEFGAGVRSQFENMGPLVGVMAVFWAIMLVLALFLYFGSAAGALGVLLPAEITELLAENGGNYLQRLQVSFLRLCVFQSVHTSVSLMLSAAVTLHLTAEVFFLTTGFFQRTKQNRLARQLVETLEARARATVSRRSN